MAGNNAASDGRSSYGLPWWQGDGQAVWHPLCHRQGQADPHRRDSGSCHIPSQQDGVCSVHRATTLQPAPTVSFTFHVEHCCHALFYLLANLNIAMSAVPGVSWMSGVRQMLMPVWTDEVFSTVGPLGTGSGKARMWGGMHGSAAWGWQEGSLLLLGSSGQNLFVSQRSSFQNAITRIQEMKTMMKWMTQFLLNFTFSRYFDSEFLQGKKNNKILQLPLCGDIFHTCLFQDRSLL